MVSRKRGHTEREREAGSGGGDGSKKASHIRKCEVNAWGNARMLYVFGNSSREGGMFQPYRTGKVRALR